MASISKRTKHIRVRYYFIKDHMFMRYIVVKHYPIGEVYADHFTKLLQGALFQKIRSEIQGIPATMTDKEMCWDEPGMFNMVLNTTNTATSKPSTHECVKEEQNYDLHMDTSRITGEKKGLTNNCCRGTKSCAEHNDSCRGTKSCAEHIDSCICMKSCDKHNRLEAKSCRGTNSSATHIILET